MNIYIDFDRTLFDTDNCLNDLDKILESCDINVDTFIMYSKMYDDGFNPYTILHLMEKDYDINQNIYSEIDKFLLKLQNYVYNDVHEFLKKCKKENYRIIILTKGNDEYQLLKIRNANLLDYIDGVLVTLKDKGEMDLDYQNSIFIDDSPEELESILKRKPKRIIRINRLGTKYSGIIINSKIESVSNLLDIQL